MNTTISATAVSVIASLIKDDSDVVLREVKQGVEFECGDTLIVARGYAGEYIKYDNAIPTNFKSHFCVEKSALETAINRASLFVDGKTPAIHVCVKVNELKIESESADGTSSDIIEIANGDDAEFYFNPKYLATIAKVAQAATLFVYWNEKSSVVVEDGKTTKFLIMPIRRYE